MNLGIKVEKFGSGDLRWLGSAHGTGSAKTVTLSVKSFASLKETFGGVIPAGTPLKRNEDGLYELVTGAGDALAGFLFTDQANDGDVQVAPMVWHGRILAGNLPDTGFDITTLSAPNAAFTIEKKEGK